MRRHLLRVAPLAFCVLVLAPPRAAQQNANLEQGLKPFGSYQGGNIDSVSLTNRNLTLHIPLVSYPQRGGKLRLDFFVRYNNKGWQVKETIGGGGQETRYWEWKGKGVEVVRDQTINIKTTIMRVQNWLGDELIVNLKDAITADGSSHQLEQGSDGMESVDASGIMYQWAGPAIDRLGIRYTNVAMSGDSPVEPNLEDPNGNKITYGTSGWTDTQGRVIPKRVTTTNLSGCPTGTVSAELWNLPGPSGGTSQIKFCYANYTLQPSFGIPGINEPAPPIQKFMNAIILPNQTKWQFQYNSFGDLTQITFPTGGTISYGWGTWGVCSGGATPVSRVVTSRSLNANDGAGPRTWTYSVDTVTDPAGNDTVFTKTGVGEAFCSRYVSKVESYQGTGGSRTLLKTVETFYDGMDNPRNLYTSDGTAINVVAIRTKTTWPNGKVAEQTTTYDSGNTFTFWNAYDEIFETYPLVYGSVMQTTESEYGSGAPGSILRKTVNEWLWTSNSNYRTRNMLDLLSTVTVQDGAGTQIARSEYLYDETTPVTSGISMQHQIPPSVGSYRGNLTSAKRWLNTNGSYPTTVTSYYDTGMPYRTWDPGSHMTEFSYSGSFYGAYVTQTRFPDTNSPNYAQHIISGSYDFNSGLLTSFSDENGQTSTYSYDNMWRFTTAIFPSQGALGSGQTNFYYPDAVTVERKQKIDGTRWTDLYVRFDGLGREIRRITANDQATPWDQVDTCYDARGLTRFVSYPYQGNGLSAPQVCSGAGDLFDYDGLGRVITVTHSDSTTVLTTYTGPAARVQDEGNGTTRVERVTQVDGLGRLKAVCEKSSTTLIGITPTPSECGLDIGTTGFLTTYGYSYDLQGNHIFTVQQGGLNPRTAKYDSLGRLFSAENPESGKIEYTYNSDDLVTGRLAPTPNQADPNVKVTTNYSYDELHRACPAFS